MHVSFHNSPRFNGYFKAAKESVKDARKVFEDSIYHSSQSELRP